ncbi:DsbA family protein [Nitrosospira briensis]|uniref:DsbA family protein n=1 Tax=Nitrosospira briensis TaxID=35799 RepID=UPI00046AF9B5|nr:DsbA family protein [Nitrosospira briensis]
MSERKLWYVADPMCSWCWGFSPVIEVIQREYGGRFEVELLLGGLRPGAKQPMLPTQREQILHHWRAVQQRTAQPFRFEGAMPEGFVYDTEPASRGVVAVSLINREAIFSFFKMVQSAFYVEQQDVTNPIVLSQLAARVGIDAQQFGQAFESDIAKRLTLEHFQKASQWGVHGFPTVIGQSGADYRLLNTGYCSLDELRPKLDGWLLDQLDTPRPSS